MQGSKCSGEQTESQSAEDVEGGECRAVIPDGFRCSLLTLPQPLERTSMMAPASWYSVFYTFLLCTKSKMRLHSRNIKMWEGPPPEDEERMVVHIRSYLELCSMSAPQWELRECLMS